MSETNVAGSIFPKTSNPPYTAQRGTEIPVAIEQSQPKSSQSQKGLLSPKLSFLKSPLFLTLVGFPNLCTIIYFGLIASPIYESEAVLRVSSPVEQAKSQSSSISSLLGGSHDSPGIWMLKDRLDTFDEFKSINSQYDIQKLYSRGDFVTRVGGLSSSWRKGTGDVALWKYYQRIFDMDVDENTGDAKLTVTGWTAEDAHNIATALVHDAIVNLNYQDRQQDAETITAAELECDRLRKALSEDDIAIAAWRAQSGALDPKIDYASLLDEASQLNTKRIELKGQFEAISRNAPNSPSAISLQSQMAVINGGVQDSLNSAKTLFPSASTYEGLTIKRETDAKLLEAAGAALQQARINAAQNHYYVEMIGSPSNPKSPSGPYSLKWVSIVFIVSMILYAVLG